MFWRNRQERDLEDELQFHLSQAQQKYGSRAQAAARLGGEDAAKEACRDQRRGAWLASVGRDLRLGARLLRKSPAYAAAAVLTLALCIAITVAVFSLVEATLLPAIPFAHADRLVRVIPVMNGFGPLTQSVFPAAGYADARSGAPAFAQLAAYNTSSFNLAAKGTAAHLSAMAITPNLFAVLGAAPARGRGFIASDTKAVILSDRVWRKQFGGGAVLGQSVTLNGTPYTVVGIMPRGFAQRPYGAPGPFATQLWVPLDIPPAGWQHTAAAAAYGGVYAVGRLRAGATLAEAQQQLAAIAQRNAAKYPEDHHRSATAMTLLQVARFNTNAPAILMFLILAALILLVGCANIAGLGLGRAAARSDEMAIRRALGAGRGRLLRQVLTESCLLAAIAGALGLFVGWLGIRTLSAGFGTVVLPMDGRALAVTLLAAAVTALASGLAPALRTTALARTRGAVAGHSRGRNLLVAAEVCLTVTSLIVIAAVVQSIWHELHWPLGFQTTGVMAAELDLRGPSYATASAQVAFARRLRRAAQGLPGVQTAALVSPPPLDWSQTAVALRGQAPLDWNRLPRPRLLSTSGGYLQTLQIPLLAGRGFTAADVAGAPPVALISRSVAHRLFRPGVNPIGRYIRVGDLAQPWRQIVGEIGELARYPGDPSTNGEIFEPLAQAAAPQTAAFALLVRASANPDALIAPLRHALAQTDPAVALYNTGSLTHLLGQQGNATDAVVSYLLELMAALALLLSAIGLYSVVAYAAATRRRELGIRIALGATGPQLQRFLLRGGLRVTLAGLAAGAGLGWMALRPCMSVENFQKATLSANLTVPITLVAVVAAIAIYLPARRAAHADPNTALRVE